MKAKDVKTKFRTTKLWKEFRQKMRDKQNGLDYITGKKLNKFWNLHHLDMSIENYEKLEEDNFICLNKQMHETIHILFRYYKNDKDILNRIKQVLDKMIELNELNK